MTFQNLTPPKYAARLDDKRKQVLLEERLKHFMIWLQERVWPIEPKEDKDIDALIEEYVNG